MIKLLVKFWLLCFFNLFCKPSINIEKKNTNISGFKTPWPKVLEQVYS